MTDIFRYIRILLVVAALVMGGTFATSALAETASSTTDVDPEIVAIEVATTTVEEIEVQDETSNTEEDSVELTSESVESEAVAETSQVTGVTIRILDLIDGPAGGPVGALFTNSTYPITWQVDAGITGGAYKLFFKNINSGVRTEVASNVNVGGTSWRVPENTERGRYIFGVEYVVGGNVVAAGVSEEFWVETWPEFHFFVDKGVYSPADTISLQIKQYYDKEYTFAVDLYANDQHGNKQLLERGLEITNKDITKNIKISDVALFDMGTQWYGFLVCAVKDNNCAVRMPNTNAIGFVIDHDQEVSPLKVTSPVAGETWVKGTSKTITWEDDAGMTDRYDLYMWQDYTNVGFIATTTGSARSFTWSDSGRVMVNGQSIVLPDGEYKVQVCRGENETLVCDESDGFITLTTTVDPKPMVYFSSPVMHGTWYKGQTYDVRWRIAHAPAGITKINVMLVHPRTFTELVRIASDLPISATTTAWTVPTSLASDQYKVLVRYYDEAGERLAGGSSGTFTITNLPPGDNQPPTVEVSGPSSLRVHHTGTWTVTGVDPEGKKVTYTINWGDNSAEVTAGPLTSGTAHNFTRTYSSTGTYTITIKVTDEDGLTTTTTRTVNITAPSGGGGGGGGYVDTTPPTAPVINLASHKVNIKTALKTVVLGWLPSTDVGRGVAGYSFIWSRSADVRPSGNVDTDKLITYQELDNGIWYFHIQAVDHAGNLSAVTTYGPIVIGPADKVVAPVKPTTPVVRPAAPRPVVTTPTTTDEVATDTDDFFLDPLDPIVDDSDRGFFQTAAAGFLNFIRAAWWWIIILILLGLLIWNIMRGRDRDDTGPVAK
jgi:hypothetical protein